MNDHRNIIVCIDGDDIQVFADHNAARSMLEAIDVHNKEYRYFSGEGGIVTGMAVTPDDIWRSDIVFSFEEPTPESILELKTILRKWFTKYRPELNTTAMAIQDLVALVPSRFPRF